MYDCLAFAGALAFALLTHAPASARGPLFTLVGSAPGERFGAAVAGVGDVDQDGRPDLVIGAPRAECAGVAAGVARVVSGADGRTLFRFGGSSVGAQFGAAVAGAGDVDADGVPDVLVGAPQEGASGRAFVFSGSDGSLVWSFAGDAAGDRFGQAVASAGDADGDGCADVLVGAPYADHGGAQAGRAVVLSGRTGLVLHAFDGAGFDFLGFAVGAAGDLDGDGCSDVLLGAPFSDVGAFNAGSAWVRSGRDGSVLLALHGAQIGEQLGASVRSGGDVDGDGRPDLLLGAPGADAGAIDSGAIQVRSGASGALLFTIAGLAEGDALFALDFAGDVDGDGHADVLAGAASSDANGKEAGHVRLVSGRTGADLATFAGRAPRDWFGAQVAGVGDLDGDGRPDCAFGAPGHDDDLSKPGYVQVSPSP